MRLFGLIGYPLTHSFSKNYFSKKFEAERLFDCRYELFPIDNIDKLPALLRDYPNLQGLNVTIPYKQDVMAFLHHTRGLPASLNACNTIRIRQGVLEGFNTDWVGFENSLKPLLKSHHTRALILGNGGAAKAVMYVLKRLNIPFEVVSRLLHDGSTLTYNDLDSSVITTHPLIVNTTPLGTYPNMEHSPPILYDAITNRHLLYDLVYNPEITQFMARGLKQGAVVKNGQDMLVGQAEESWRIWNEPV